MANTPKNIYLNEISTTTLTEIGNPSAGETYTNLWLSVTNTAAASNSFNVYINDGSTDRLMVSGKAIPEGGQFTFTQLAGVKINENQALKIESTVASTYIVSFNASVIT